MQIIDHIRQEWSMLKGAPLAFVLLLSGGLSVGVGIGLGYYQGRLAKKDGQFAR
jgi:hypothetical protein